MRRIGVIDSHTEGEPTRIVVSGGPELGDVDPLTARDLLRDQHDWLRKACVLEPRGYEAIVGGLLLPPSSSEADAGIVYFNNAGYLGMCGHGTIGLAMTLAHGGRFQGDHLTIETPVGLVEASVDRGAHSATITNVPSYLFASDVVIQVPGYPEVVGDIAYGGNWFFLADAGGMELSLSNLEALTALTVAIRKHLDEQGITGKDGAKIDHIELFGPPHDPANHSRNFVLCPGLAYDRSPCGTGTSAKLATLAARGKLGAGDPWLQESVIGSRFEGRYAVGPEGTVIPSISGRAFITAESELLIDNDDPFGQGIPSGLH